MTVYVSAVYQRPLKEIEIPEALYKNMRRADDFIRLAVVAAFAIIRPRKGHRSEHPDAYGLFLGSAFGPMQTNLDVLDSVVSGQESSPTCFSHSVSNAAVGYVASVLDIRGCALALTDFAYPFYSALREGYLAIASRRLDCCLVLQVETYSNLLQDAQKEHVPGGQDWQPGVVCWLLERGKPGKNAGHHLESLKIANHQYEPLAYLRFGERLYLGNQAQDVHDPLGSARIISDVLQGERGPAEVSCRLHGLWGDVSLELKR